MVRQDAGRAESLRALGADLANRRPQCCAVHDRGVGESRVHLGKAYELTGPRAETLREVAEDFTRVLGRSITYMDIPLEPWLESLRSIGASAHVVAHLESMALRHPVTR